MGNVGGFCYNKIMKYTTKSSGKKKQWASGYVREIDTTKPRFDLIPTELLTRLAELYARGAVKYGDENYKLAKSPEELHRFKESAWRHFVAWVEGQEDEDHCAATVWNLFSWEWHKSNTRNTS
jgi:hypothetical protein